MKAQTFHRLHSLRMDNDAAGYAMQEQAPRFARIAGRHENGTAPRAVSAYQLFQTPPALAARMVELAGDAVRGRVLEPSAGLGRILDAIAPFAPVATVAVEMAAPCAAELFRQDRPGVRILQRDFLTVTTDSAGQFDAVLMNPPFHLRSDVQHILHARNFLAPGGILVAICMDTHHRESALRGFCHHWEPLPADTFSKEGTKTGTVLLAMKRQAKTLNQ